MYAVIFRATIKQVDEQYTETAAQMRELAQRKYGCTGLVSLCDGEEEITISYWPSLEHIHAWKHDAEHLHAQARGKSDWYRSYQVQVVEVLREYRNDLSALYAS